MNVQLANVISDLSGLTGQLIVRAIVGGERDPQKLAELRDPRIQASPEEVAKSLEGDWRPELLFLVKQEVDTYDTYQKRIAECDQQLQQQLASFASVAPEVAAAPVTQVQGDDQPKQAKAKRKKPAKNAPRFNLEQELQRVAGVDLTRIDGIDVMVAQTILAEIGLDMGRWKTEGELRLLVGIVSRQSDHRRQGSWPRHTPCGKPCSHGLTHGRQRSAA
jgi:transposase